MKPQEALVAFQNQTMTGKEIIQVFLEYSQWILPLEKNPLKTEMPEVSIYRDLNGNSHWNIYDSEEAMEACIVSGGNYYRPEYFIKVNGYYVFSILPDSISYLNINPEMPFCIHYKNSQFAFLRSTSSAMKIDIALRDLLFVSEDQREPLLREILNYNDYKIISSNGQLLKAPDSRNRILPAIFTLEPEASYAIDDARNAGVILKEDIVEISTLEGKNLFKLLESLPIDGVVFNFPGKYAPSRAFVPELVNLIHSLKD